MNRYRELLYERPDRHDDDCERCHEVSSQLWTDPYTEGEYLLCADCVRAVADFEEMKEALQRGPIKLRPARE